MDSQVKSAIEIAYDPRSDSNLKQQAFEFLSQLRLDPQGWQVCLSIATREPWASEVARHVALDIVNDGIRRSRIDEEGLMFTKERLLAHVQSIYGNPSPGTQQDPVVIQNKIIQAITSLFTRLYAVQWRSFFDDFLSITSYNTSSAFDNLLGTSLYLKVLNSIHDEIADVLVQRTSDEQTRDGNLKDLVRERDVQKIAQSWHSIILQWKTQDAGIVVQCLYSIGRWASWTDLSLIIDESLLELMFNSLGAAQVPQGPQKNKLLIASLHTFTELLGKKMKPVDKLELIEILRMRDVISQLVMSPSLNELRPTSNYDTDFAEDVAKLVNNTVADIVNALEKTSDTDPAWLKANAQLQEFLPFMLRFFSDEYDEICATVIPCLTDLLSYFRKRSKLNPDYSIMLPPILKAIIQKMKYDETSSWGNEDAQTDEAEFQELRKRLQVLQQVVAAVDEPLYIETISTIIVTSLDNFQAQQGQVDWRDLDLAMHEMFLFGELAMKNGGLYNKTKPVSVAAERLIGMMFKLVESEVANFSHPSIQLQYMEICVRYATFFEANPHLIPRVLEEFVRLVHHNHIKVRTRSWYLFHRYIKTLRQHMGNIAQTVIQALGDLLPIKAELPEENSENDDMSSEDDDHSAEALFTSQLYLYETIGCICGTPAVPEESQVLYLQTVMNPLITDLENHLGQARNADPLAILQIHHLVMALGNLARGFSDWTPTTNNLSNPPAKAVSQEFARTAEAVLLALESLNSHVEIRTAARFTLSRLVGVLGNYVLPQLIRWIDGLLSRTSSKDEMALFLRLLDQIIHGFKTEIFDILNTLLSPLLQRVFSGMSEPTAGTDDEIQLAELKREYLGFLLVILNNDLGSVLVSNANQPVFETVISTIEHFTKDVTDFPTAKLSFQVLTHMVTTWGGPDIPASGTVVLNGDTQPTQPGLPGFDRFVMERFSPLCWALPSNSTFNPKDAQGRLVLAEAAGLQKAIYTKNGEEYLDWLRDVELRGMGMDDSAINGYLAALCNSDSKQFRRYFQNLVQRSNR